MSDFKIPYQDLTNININNLIVERNALIQENKQLKNQKQQVIEYMNSLEFLELMNSENKEDYFKAKSKLLEILGDKENE